MTIEKLTDSTRALLLLTELGAPVVALIDQLTAALEAAEKNLQSRMHCRYCDEGMTCELYTELESRAEALQARVAELEAENRELSRRPTLECARQTESELADLRGRVKRALELCEPYAGRLGPIVEVLRGR